MQETGMRLLLLGFDTEFSPDRDIELSLKGVAAITRILTEHKVGATFFVVGELLSSARRAFRELLTKSNLFDVQSHSYTHCHIKDTYYQKAVSLRQVDEELKRTNDLIGSVFDTQVIGFRVPGNFYEGLRGERELLSVIWNNGIRFVGSNGMGLWESLPAPFTQPYWYADEGFPDLLEVPITGWHCCTLYGYVKNVPALWPPIEPWGLPPHPPKDLEEGIRIFRKEFEYAINNDLVYSPGFHPWSLYKFDAKISVLSVLLEIAENSGTPVKSFRQFYMEKKSEKNNA